MRLDASSSFDAALAPVNAGALLRRRRRAANGAECTAVRTRNVPRASMQR
jgi:hypothetical protein